MATFAELVADVKTLTNRPDLDTEVKLAVKVATLKAHQSDFYPKDLYETAIQWNPIAYQQSLDYRTLIPRWRAFKYLRKYDATTTPGTPGAFIEMIAPEQALDGYGINRDDVCYLAGTDIEIRSSTEDTYMLVGCYLQPDITESSYSSWIALEYPFVIEFEAASKIYKMTGFDEQAVMASKEATEQLIILRNNSILAQGY